MAATLASNIVPPVYGYTILAVTGTFFLGFWHGLRVGQFRKAAGLGYPTPYADTAQMNAADPEKKKAMYLFNCAQRAHGNFLENLPCVVPAMLIGGLRFPVATALAGLGWGISRIVYAVGYTDKNKTNGSGRMLGSFFWLFQLGMFVMTGMVGYDLISKTF
ncbi:Uu.00g108600.m01.CDS01 [Anthostomella pinea]|uniref:Uu.00g108600.m01.CDS01 n=1 Tax=Anthostomella pinea TaxID=933095 RepID=A0AAI8VEK0_9PEZI|nr:Uu.00g108600.m01.CDS01 [Anthostomella pinea]